MDEFFETLQFITPVKAHHICVDPPAQMNGKVARKVLPPRSSDYMNEIERGSQLITLGLKRLKKGVISANDLEEDTVHMGISLNFMMIYK